MRVAVGSDHAGFAMKGVVIEELKRLGHEVADHGAYDDKRADFPDFVAPVGRALQAGEAERGVLLCGSGVGVCVAANKMRGVRACVTHDTYSAHQGVEHDGMNVLCIGGNIVGASVARELVQAFMSAEFQREERFIRRMNKVDALEAEMLTR
jgi:ribose 5-phosphate isomerase B